MPTLRDLRIRIKGVQSTQKITSAMKMVAASKLKRAQESIVNARPYARKVFEMLNHLVTESDRLNNPLILKREVLKVALVVVTSDRGLCGAFNTNILREANNFIKNECEANSIVPSIFCVGRKSYDFFKKRPYPIVNYISGIFGKLKFENALTISNFLVTNYLKGDFDEVVIIYNEFKSVIQQKVVRETFLPIPFEYKKEVELKADNYIFEPDKIMIFERMLQKHLRAHIWRILLESNAAEFGARMTAMDNATTNAKELIRVLKLNYNKARQAAITKELLEVVSGANALRAN